MKKPCWNRTCPCPRHCEHTLGDDPLDAPDPLAGLAGFLARDLDRRLGAFRRFLERDLEVVAEVGAALRSAAPATAAEEIAEPEHAAENVREVAELAEDRRIEAGAARGGFHAGMTEAVVEAALLGIGQNRIGFGRLLEPIFRGLVAGVPIGMRLHRDLPVGALELALVGRSGDAEHFVVVAFAHALATFTIAGRSRRSPSMYPRLSSPMTSPSRCSGLTSCATA